LRQKIATRFPRKSALILGIALAAQLGTPAVAAIAADTHYTHRTTLKNDCAIHENYPKQDVPDRAWSKGSGRAVGVRYTYTDYAMVLDYAKQDSPNWGFIAKSCLADPSARSQGDSGAPLPDLKAIGGHNEVKDVLVSAAHTGSPTGTPIHLGSVGSFRSEPRSFVIGNLRASDALYITTPTCGHHGPEEWILGYAPAAGRWGYVEAMHLPACH
jgi:hypothetical protein